MESTCTDTGDGPQMAQQRGRSGQTCCVPGCDSNTVKSQGLSWHKFPTDTAMKKVWLKRINRMGQGGKYSLWQPKPSHRICGIHFNKTGRKTYDDKVPQFFPAKTFPEWKQEPSRPVARRKRPRHLATASPMDITVQEPVLMPEMDLASIVTVGPPLQQQDVHIVHDESCVMVQHVDHPYSVSSRGSPRKALTEKKEQVAALFETSSQLQAELKAVQEENRKLQDRARQLEIDLANCQLQSMEKPLPTNHKSLELLQDERKLRFYTGFENSQRFLLFYTFIFFFILFIYTSTCSATRALLQGG